MVFLNTSSFNSQVNKKQLNESSFGNNPTVKLVPYNTKIFFSLGWKSIETVLNYQPSADLETREDMAMALQTRKRVTRNGGGEAQPGPSNASNYECQFGCQESFDSKKDLYHHIYLEHNDLLDEENDVEQSGIFRFISDSL